MTTSEAIKARLLASAQDLTPPSNEAAKEYAQRALLMAEEVTRILEARQDLDQLVGLGNRQMMRDNHRNHARFMASLLSNYEPGVLVETVIWVFRAYRSHGFAAGYWMVQLDTWLDVFQRTLTDASLASIKPVYDWMTQNIQGLVELSKIMPPPVQQNDQQD